MSGSNGHAELNELERVKLENFALKHNALQHQLQMNLTERTAFIRAVEESHPGYKWDEQQGLIDKDHEAAASKG